MLALPNEAYLTETSALDSKPPRSRLDGTAAPADTREGLLPVGGCLSDTVSKPNIALDPQHTFMSRGSNERRSTSHMRKPRIRYLTAS